MSRFSATDDLLTRGVAAARDDDRGQARFYLEWALREDPTTQQAIDAWYWLSRLTDDQAERRRCLDHVLSLAPIHPEARRDLAILDGRLDPAAMIDPNRPLAPLTPPPPAEPTMAETRRCPRCGGIIRFSALHQAVACGFCGARDEGQPGAAVTEQDWFATAFTARGHRWVLAAATVLRCQGCGATHTLPAGQVSGTCPFCASPHLAPATIGPDLMAPDGIVPFAFDEAGARDRLRDWQARRGAARRLTVSAPRPIYLPVWTFDIEATVAWRREPTDHDEGLPWGQAHRRLVTTGDTPLSFDDVLVPATTALPTTLLDTLTFDTSASILYADEVLTGWPAEVYSVPLTTASLTARERTRAQCDNRVAGLVEVAGETLTITRVELQVATYKLLLVPVWMATARQEGQDRPLAVNGQSGQVQDSEPGRWQRFLSWLTG